MAEQNYIALVDKLSHRLLDVMEQRWELEARLKELDVEERAISKSLTHLRPLTGEIDPNESFTGMGLTTAIWVVVNDSTNRLSAKEIYKQLEERGFSFAGYEMPMASIYTTLERLHKKSKIRVEKEGYNKFFARPEPRDK